MLILGVLVIRRTLTLMLVPQAFLRSISVLEAAFQTHQAHVISVFKQMQVLYGYSTRTYRRTTFFFLTFVQVKTTLSFFFFVSHYLFAFFFLGRPVVSRARPVCLLAGPCLARVLLLSPCAQQSVSPIFIRVLLIGHACVLSTTEDDDKYRE